VAWAALPVAHQEPPQVPRGLLVPLARPARQVTQRGVARAVVVAVKDSTPLR